MNAITLLKNDHRTVEKLFKRFEKAGERAYVEKRGIIEKIVEELSVHAAIEEQVFYPAVRRDVDGVEDLTLEALEEHHVAKWILSELDAMAPEDERYVAKATVLIESVRHHVEEEERDLFPKVARDLSARQLDDLGDRLDRAKGLAPTRPHPRSPDTPPANLVTGPAAAIADRATGAVRDLARSAIERVTGGADDVAEEVSEIAGSAAATAKGAGRAVRSKAAGVAGTAKEQTTRKARTAKKAASRTAPAAKRVARTTKTAARSTRKPAKRASAKTTRSATPSAKGAASTATRPARATEKAAGRSARAAKRTTSGSSR